MVKKSEDNTQAKCSIRGGKGIWRMNHKSERGICFLGLYQYELSLKHFNSLIHQIILCSEHTKAHLVQPMWALCTEHHGKC